MQEETSSHILVSAQGEADQPEYRYAARDIKEGLERMVPAARTRANAVYYGFIVLSLGLIVMVRPCQHCIALPDRYCGDADISWWL